MTDEQEVARIFLDIEAVHFCTEPPFRFTSGVLSPTYVDCRKLISFPKQRNRVLEILENKIHGLDLDAIDYIAGGETAGIPYASFLAERLALPMIYVRKKPKGFGKHLQIEGFLKEGSSVLLVEDLMFDAGSKLNFKSAIEAAESRVLYLICIFSYGFKLAEERLREAGLRHLSLTNWSVLIEEAEERNYFNVEQAKKIRNFLENPKEWAIKTGIVK